MQYLLKSSLHEVFNYWPGFRTEGRISEAPCVVNMDWGIGELMCASYSADVMRDTGNFECNICFELALEPIVTLCGHLYCWPCLYQWLQIHSHSHECPVCKALVQEEKLVPIYGRGKNTSDTRSRPTPGVTIPSRPMGQRPPTAPRVDMNYIRGDGLDPMAGFMPTTASRFGNLTFSSLFSAIPAIFNLQMHGFHDATVYGATSGVPYLFSSSFHGNVHGFHHYHFPLLEWKPIAWMIIFAIIGFLILLHLIN